MERITKIILVLIGINLIVLDAVLIKQFFSAPVVNNSPVVADLPNNSIIETKLVDNCGAECQEYVDQKISSLAANLKLPTPIPTKTTSIAAPKAKVTSVSYVPIPGSGSTAANDWTDISGTDFYLNTTDYPGLTQVQFEATIRLLNGNGSAYVRLFDVTHGIAVQGSELNTSNQSSTAVVASPVSFWAGKNLIRIQAKSLTADTAIYDGGRVKVISQN